jgi:hypothetical protein
MTRLEDKRGSSGSDAMTSFAVDVVRQLGVQLDTIQERHDWATSEDNSSSSSSASIQQDQQDSSQKREEKADVIDVTNSTSLHSTKQLQTALQRSGQDQVIDLAKVTYAAYGVVLDQLLKDAERVNDQAWYWTEVEEDPSRTFIYLVQSELDE